MPVHGGPPLDIEAYVELQDWVFFEVLQPPNSIHAAGLRSGQVRVCSPIVKYNPDNRTFVTESGRVYKLMRQAKGNLSILKYGINHWLYLNHLSERKSRIFKDIPEKLK